MTKAELKTLSNSTFYDNNVGGIAPSAHRNFNDKLIDAIPADAAMATYIVDSAATMTAWANNAAGNDYSSVFIKAGKYTAPSSINLHTTGTKVVIAQVGNEITFGANQGFIYNGQPSSPEFYMMGLNVVSHGYTGAPATPGVFNNCINLINCRVYYAADVVPSNITAYANCKRLVRCFAYVLGRGTSAKVFGFFRCNDLLFCESWAEVENGGTSAQSNGYNQCTGMQMCSGYGRTDGAGSGYGFNACRVMFGCYPASDSTKGTYYACYMHASGTNDSVADTAAGGYNRS
jgi:hypothetical protein|nr:MAG TPA: hypothetical protein [Caudoviricetes sp.]